ncbi:ATP-dependent DNA helicase [Mycoplasmopsis iners]|uniref:ATP-dependent DNA helicase n=1 Tax=Mycoplasmopsis iners TaxID=76630 RepID=UPI000496F849|nr:AAA family ATPase [Mycoplasmopsis iners]
MNSKDYKNKETNNSFKGRFIQIIKGGESLDWAYTFAKFKTNKNKEIFVYLTKNVIDLNTFYEIETIFDEERRTYRIEKLSVSEPKNEEIEKIIIENVKGLGVKKIEKVKKTYGQNWIDEAKNHNYYIDLFGQQISEDLEQIILKLNDQNFSFFVNNNLSLLHNKLVELYGQIDFLEIFKNQNVYDLFIEYDLDFNQVHLFAQLLYSDILDNKKIFWIIKGIIFYYLSKQYLSNNTRIQYNINEIHAFVSKYFCLDLNLLEENIQKLFDEKELIFFESDLTFSSMKMYYKEKEIVDFLIDLKQRNSNNITEVYKSNKWSKKQEEAFLKAINNSISIISGYPGTGKSYVISGIYDYLINEKIYKESEIEILTPTGRAASNLIKKGLKARTIHSFLKLEKTEKIKSVDNSPKTNTKVIIIDEFSMVNIDLFHFLIKMCPNIEKMILVGDWYQLPCIGPGNMLDELMKSNYFNSTELDEIFRTDKQEIANHFIGIKNNSLVDLGTNSVNFFEIKKDELMNKITQLFSERTKKFGIDNVIILTPMNNYVKSINEIIQKSRLNNEEIQDKPFDLLFENKPIYIGDKLIQIVNDYQKDVYNGEIGFFKGVKNSKAIVDFDYKTVEYELNEVKENLRLAYAITIHKFQGSETDSVIFTVFSDFLHMLNNKLIYTATSRAKENLTIIGNFSLYSEKIYNKNNNKYIKTSMLDLINQRKA